ncbi:MAG: four helix bundle protein [Phycisphaerales bacterium]
MDRAELQGRFEEFALRVIRLFRALPKTTEAAVIGKQLVRCGTSPGANYRAACRGRSRADFIAKLAIVEEEIDESCYWLDLLVKADIMKASRIESLRREADALTAIVTAARKTSSKR